MKEKPTGDPLQKLRTLETFVAYVLNQISNFLATTRVQVHAFQTLGQHSISVLHLPLGSNHVQA